MSTSESLPHIEVRVEGVPVSLGDLDPHLVRKAATYRLLKHFGVSLEEVIYLTNPLSDAILVEDAKPRPQLAEPIVKELTAPQKRRRKPAQRSLASIPDVHLRSRRMRIVNHIYLHPEGSTDFDLCLALLATNLGVVRMICVIMAERGWIERRWCADGLERNYPLLPG